MHVANIDTFLTLTPSSLPCMHFLLLIKHGHMSPMYHPCKFKPPSLGISFVASPIRSFASFNHLICVTSVLRCISRIFSLLSSCANDKRTLPRRTHAAAPFPAAIHHLLIHFLIHSLILSIAYNTSYFFHSFIMSFITQSDNTIYENCEQINLAIWIQL